MSVSRRRFLSASAGCGCYLAAAGPFMPAHALRKWSEGQGRRVLGQEPFARLEEAGPGLTAVISTPLGGDFTTICNGGIIEGSSGTLVVEAFGTPEGARWVAEHARRLTGRWPTHVVVTHHHGDHTAGPAGFASEGGAPGLHVTEDTKGRVLSAADQEAARAPWADVVILPGDQAVAIDLGDRSVTVVPQSGHTSSDVTVEVDGGEGPIWCGDLVWNAMFPNYVDAVPSRLSQTVRALQARPTSTYVGGHGPISDEDALSRYVAMIDAVEEAGRSAHQRGLTAEEAASEFQLPTELGEWVLFNPAFYERAMQAWLDDLGR